MHNHRNSKAIWNEARSRSIKVVCKFELITSLLPPYVECFPRPRSNLHLARKWQNIAGKSVRRKKTERGGTVAKGRRAEKQEEEWNKKLGWYSKYHFGKGNHLPNFNFCYQPSTVLSRNPFILKKEGICILFIFIIFLFLSPSSFHFSWTFE